MNYRKSDKYVVLLDFSSYYTWKNIKKSYQINKLKTLARKWNDKVKLKLVPLSTQNKTNDNTNWNSNAQLT